MWDDTGIEGSLSSSINSTATSPDLKIPHCIFLFQILHLQPFGNVSTMQFPVMLSLGLGLGLRPENAGLGLGLETSGPWPWP